MKKFFLPMLLLLSVMGLTQSAEKLRLLTQNTTGWEDYRAAGRLLYQSFGNLFSVANALEKSSRKDISTKEAEPNPVVYVTTHLSNAIVFSNISSPTVGIVQQISSSKITWWSIPIKITGSHQQTDRGPDPAAGYRIFMEIVKRSSKLDFLF